MPGNLHTARDREDAARNTALGSFLYLGERLRSGDRAGEHGEPVPAEGLEALFEAIQGDIIPRLMLAHRAREKRAPHADADATALAPEDHAGFLRIVMGDSAAATRRFVATLLQRGVPRESIFLELLTGAARRLGELWDADLCDFSDVTIGMCRLHQVLREQTASIRDDVPPGAPRILLATACADQHVFGVVMVGEFFRREGWRVWSEPGASRGQLEQILAEESFDLLGLSAACSTLAGAIGDEIAALRRASCNASLRILVGGRLFAEEPGLARRLGADGAAPDARSAPSVGKSLLSPTQRRRPLPP